MTMKIDVRKEGGGVAVVSIEGDVDMHTSPGVRDALVPNFQPAVNGIVVDLSGVGYMDSSGIATMIEGLQWSTKEGKRFVLAGLGPAVMDVFALTNLKDVFEFSPDAESAIDVLKGG